MYFFPSFYFLHSPNSPLLYLSEVLGSDVNHFFRKCLIWLCIGDLKTAIWASIQIVQHFVLQFPHEHLSFHDGLLIYFGWVQISQEAFLSKHCCYHWPVVPPCPQCTILYLYISTHNTYVPRQQGLFDLQHLSKCLSNQWLQLDVRALYMCSTEGGSINISIYYVIRGVVNTYSIWHYVKLSESEIDCQH